MEYPKLITIHEKNKHLQYNHRVIIELRLKDGLFFAKVFCNEMQRKTVTSRTIFNC